MTQTPPLIINPREVPSVSWLEAGIAVPTLSTFPDWPFDQWQNLTQQRIQSALHGADQVSHLWTHDLVFERSLMPAAVLVLLVASDTGYQVVLTTRAQHLRHHPGQVSFVGGRLEGRETVEEAALREAFEEIHLDIERVNVLGALPNYQTISGFSVAPVVAVMTESDWREQNIRVDEREVDRVFLAPLHRVFDRNAMRVHTFEYAGFKRQFLSVTHTVVHDEFFIWGASMAMLHNFDLILRAHWNRG